MRWMIGRGLSVLCLVLFGCSSHHHPPAAGHPGDGEVQSSMPSAEILAPVLRPVTDLSTATATYRALNGVWPITFAELRAFASQKNLPLDAAAFRTIRFESANPHSAVVRFELHQANSGRIHLPESKGQIRLSYPSTRPAEFTSPRP